MEHKAEPQAIAQHRAKQLETLGLIASGIAHDFNNLLTSIVGQTSLALATLPPGDTARLHIEKAMKAAEFAADLTQQLLTYTKDDNPTIETINLNSLIHENLGLLNMTLFNGIQLQLALSPDLPRICASRVHLRQILMNLIINAAEAIQMENGYIIIHTGVTLFVNGRSQQMMGGYQLPAGEYVFCQVTDTGIGMTQETLDRIFDPFFTTKAKGRGLGLATSLEIMQESGGGISVTSEPDKGSTFTIYFPIHPDDSLMFTALH